MQIRNKIELILLLIVYFTLSSFSSYADELDAEFQVEDDYGIQCDCGNNRYYGDVIVVKPTDLNSENKG